MPQLGLSCRNCGAEFKADSVQALVGWYVVHVVRNHWESLVLLHEMDPEMIMDVYAFGKKYGML